MTECDGRCLTGSDIGVPSADIAYPDPLCSLHGVGKAYAANPTLEPYDPSCERYAKDMEDYDYIIADESDIDYDLDVNWEATPEQRNKYVKYNEGTYNPVNGHFLCDMCYIKAGCPSSPNGWKCP